LNLLTFAAGSSIPGAVTKGILVEFSLTGDNKIITDGGSNALKSLIAHNSPLSVAPMQNPNLGYVEEFDSGFLVVTDAKYVGDTAENQAMFSVADDVKVYEMDANDIGACSISATGAVQVIHESGQPRTKILCVYDTVIHKVAEIYVVKDTTHKITGMLKASAVGSGFDSNKAFFTIFTGGVNRAFSTTAVAPADLDKLFEFALGGGVTGDIVNGALVEFTINSDDKIIVDGDGHALKGLVKYDSPISFGTAQAGNLGFVSGYGSGLLTVTDAEIVGGTATSEDDFSLADDVNIYLYDVDKNLLDLGTAPEVVTELGAARAKVLFLYDTDGHKATDIFVIRPEILIGMVLDAGTIVSVGDGQVYADFKLAMGGEVRIISTTSAPYTDATDLLTFASGSAIPGVVTPGMLVQFHVDSVGKIMLDSDCHALKGLLKHDSPVSFGLTQTANLGYVADFSGNLLAVTAEKTVSTPPTVTVFKVADDVKVYEVDDDDIGGTTVSATGAVQVIKVAGADRTKIAFVYDRSDPDDALWKITEIYVIR
jgi:hypothetical protein